jgi:hypothetical protein
MAQLPAGFEAAKARQIFRRFVDTPAHIDIAPDQVEVTLPKRAHNPLLIAAGFDKKEIPVPWWEGPLLVLRFR